MKSKLSLFLFTVMVISSVACSKSSNNSTPQDSNPNVTINGSATDLTGYSGAMYLGSANLDSIVILNTGSTDSSLIKGINRIPPVQTTPNFLQIYLTSRSSISTATYSIGGNNVVNMIVVCQINGQRYGAATQGTVTIDTLSFSRVSGTYNATVVNGSTFVSTNISGKFGANILP